MRRTLPPDRTALLARPPATGLSRAEVVRNRQRFGTNRIAEAPARSPGATARDAARDPMLWFLLATGALFAWLGETTDALVMLAAIAPLTGMDFYLHHRTRASIEGLSGVLATEADVVRDGAPIRIASEDVVAGDLVRVAAGEAFPADGVVTVGSGLQVDETSLTGEALPVAKSPCAPGAAPGDAAWVFAGTRLLTGEARMRVVWVGKETLYGEVVRSVVTGAQERTPLQHDVARLVRTLLIAAVAICLLLAGIRLAQGFGWSDAFLSAVTLAVAAIPEEFPVALTFFLGVGVYRLARRHALVRRAVAVENIGRVGAICSDKTGTITEGRLALSDTSPAPGVPREWLLTLAAATSRPESGDPLDAVILAERAEPPADWHRTHLYPFTEDRRRETAVWERADLPPLATIKGAPETVLALCRLSGAEYDGWQSRVAALSARGRKVIGCAWMENAGPDATEPVTDLRFAGLVAVSDRVRAGVREAMAAARGAGIQVVMVTGDHPLTAVAVAREAGLADDPQPLLGDGLEQALAAMEPERLRDVSVVARATPAQKVLLVKALQRTGSLVAVTGDGVNDAPALRAADVAIAMGLRGTRPAREVSQIVLMDDNFATIVHAIAEGRQLFANLKTCFAFLLTVHIPLVATAAAVPLLGFPLLYLPVHIVWLELLIHPAAILGFQSRARATLDQPARREGRFFAQREWLAIGLTGAGIAGMVLALFVLAICGGETADHARALALTALVAALAAVLLLLGRGATRAAWAVAGCALASSLAVSGIPALAALVHLHVLSPSHWLMASALGALPALGSRFASGLRDGPRAHEALLQKG